MNTQPAKDGQSLKPADHLGLIYIEAQRMIRVFPSLEFEEVLAELYIILHNACRLHDVSKGTPSTYIVASCRKMQTVILQRIEVGKRSAMRVAFHKSCSTFDEAWGSPEPSRDQFDAVDDLDELMFLLDDCTLSDVDAIASHHMAGESLSDIGKRHAANRSTIRVWKNRAIGIAQAAAEGQK